MVRVGKLAGTTGVELALAILDPVTPELDARQSRCAGDHAFLQSRSISVFAPDLQVAKPASTELGVGVFRTSQRHRTELSHHGLKATGVVEVNQQAVEKLTVADVPRPHVCHRAVPFVPRFLNVVALGKAGAKGREIGDVVQSTHPRVGGVVIIDQPQHLSPRQHLR